MKSEEFSKYERARIIGARGLQISMNAPILLDLTEEELESINYDPLKIAEKELDSNLLPISVNRPMPEKKEGDLEKIKVEESKVSDEEKIKTEQKEEREIAESGEIMGLANSGEEDEEESSINGSEEEALE